MENLEQVVKIFENSGVEYDSVIVLEVDDLQQRLNDFSNWLTVL